jgi:hypothetical protein
MLWRQWQVWAPTALVAAIALTVVLVPLLQKRGYAIALLRQTDAERVHAEAAAAVRREFERLEGDYNYVLARKYGYPGTVQIIDDVTRVLPDDTWLTQFELKTTVKGQDMQRDVFLRGESANGSKLISLLEEPAGFARMAQPAVDHRQKQPIPGARLEDLVRLLEALEGFLQAAGPEKDRAHDSPQPTNRMLSILPAPAAGLLRPQLRRRRRPPMGRPSSSIAAPAAPPAMAPAAPLAAPAGSNRAPPAASPPPAGPSGSGQPQAGQPNGSRP